LWMAGSSSSNRISLTAEALLSPKVIEEDSRRDRDIQRIGAELHRDRDAPIARLGILPRQAMRFVADENAKAVLSRRVFQRLSIGIQHGADQLDIPLALQAIQICLDIGCAIERQAEDAAH